MSRGEPDKLAWPGAERLYIRPRGMRNCLAGMSGCTLNFEELVSPGWALNPISTI